MSALGADAIQGNLDQRQTLSGASLEWVIRYSAAIPSKTLEGLGDRVPRLMAAALSQRWDREQNPAYDPPGLFLFIRRARERARAPARLLKK